MKIAIFGLGSIGKRHAQNLVAMNETDLMGHDPTVGDIRGVAMVSLNLLWDWKPEAVLVCTPPRTHSYLAGIALEKGCHVFIEKPMATTVKDAEVLNGIARLKNRIVAVGYQLRWQLAKFRNNASGEQSVFYACLQDMIQWPSVYKKDILEEFSHELDAAQFVKGPVEAVMAKQYDSIWNINLRHLSGISYVRLHAGSDTPYRTAMAPDCVKWMFDQAENDQAYKDELKAFLDACNGKAWDQRLCNGYEAAHVCRIIEACRESAQNCSMVRL